MDLANSLYLTDILHLISQALLTPVIVVLLALIAYALWSIGSIAVEAITERRNFKANMPEFLAKLSAAAPSDIPQTIVDSGLLNRQKAALLTLWDYRCVPQEASVALAKRLVANENQRYRRIAGRNDTATKIAPMFGLMGTLIPLGPGIVALGQGDTTTLSASLGVAFDTTVAGLVVAAIAFVIARIRKNWYENYMVSLEGGMTTLLEVVDDLRSQNRIDIVEPSSLLEHFGFARYSAYRTLAETAVSEQHVATDYTEGQVKVIYPDGQACRTVGQDATTTNAPPASSISDVLDNALDSTDKTTPDTPREPRIVKVEE